MPRCVIINCNSPKISSTQRQEHISYHSFPHDPIIKEKWIAATGRKDWFPTKHSTICSIHFENISFIEGKKLRLLKKTACPTIDILKLIDNEDENEDTPQEPSSLSRKRKLEQADQIQDQVESQVQDSGELGGGEGPTIAQPTDQVAVSAEQNNITEPSSAEAVIKPEETTVQGEVEEIKPTELSADTTPSTNEAPQNNGKDNGDWQQREQELLKKIEQLEKFKNERTEDGVKLELKVREEEIDLLKARIQNLETELQAALSKPSGKNHEMIENIKQQHEELLSKARGMIFDKTKMVKNQELQIEALTTQVQSLKDINVITKDLLEIRNSEVKAMEDRLKAMEERFQVEKERYGLVLQRAQTSNTLNDDLKKEYETQLAIFKELRGKYEQRVQALIAENTKLKEIADIKAGKSG